MYRTPLIFPNTEKCCYDGLGNTCPKSPVDKTCCQEDCCNESCCNSSDCEHCESGTCEPCLYKASDYEELQGCSKVVDDPDHTPSPNGCGPEGWGHMVPDNPTGCEDTSFLEACNSHDECYGTCNSNRDGCDSSFLNAMLEVCMGSSCAYACSQAAYAYYGVVHSEGEPAWKSAQVSTCSCCDC